MSRTYRKISERQEYWIYHDIDWTPNGGCKITSINPTKKQLAMARRDGAQWDASRGAWEFKQVHRIRRRADKEQLHKYFRASDYEEVDFDTSRAEIKRKGIWWEIY